MENTKLLGRWGEEKAAAFLKKKRWKIIGMNYLTRFGEIDLIAENRQFIAFVEVKTRKSASFGEPEAKVPRFSEHLRCPYHPFRIFKV